MQRMAVLGRAAGKQFSNRQPFKSRKHQLSLEKRDPPCGFEGERPVALEESRWRDKRV